MCESGLNGIIREETPEIFPKQQAESSLDILIRHFEFLKLSPQRFSAIIRADADSGSISFHRLFAEVRGEVLSYLGYLRGMSIDLHQCVTPNRPRRLPTWRGRRLRHADLVDQRRWP